MSHLKHQMNAGMPEKLEMTGVPPKPLHWAFKLNWVPQHKRLTVFHSLQIDRVPQNKNKSLYYMPHEKSTIDSAH